MEGVSDCLQCRKHEQIINELSGQEYRQIQLIRRYKEDFEKLDSSIINTEPREAAEKLFAQTVKKVEEYAQRTSEKEKTYGSLQQLIMDAANKGAEIRYLKSKIEEREKKYLELENGVLNKEFLLDQANHKIQMQKKLILDLEKLIKKSKSGPKRKAKVVNPVPNKNGHFARAIRISKTLLKQGSLGKADRQWLKSLPGEDCESDGEHEMEDVQSIPESVEPCVENVESPKNVLSPDEGLGLLPEYSLLSAPTILQSASNIDNQFSYVKGSEPEDNDTVSVKSNENVCSTTPDDIPTSVDNSNEQLVRNEIMEKESELIIAEPNLNEKREKQNKLLNIVEENLVPLLKHQ